MGALPAMTNRCQTPCACAIRASRAKKKWREPLSLELCSILVYERGRGVEKAAYLC